MSKVDILKDIWKRYGNEGDAYFQRLLKCMDFFLNPGKPIYAKVKHWSNEPGLHGAENWALIEPYSYDLAAGQANGWTTYIFHFLGTAIIGDTKSRVKFLGFHIRTQDGKSFDVKMIFIPDEARPVTFITQADSPSQCSCSSFLEALHFVELAFRNAHSRNEQEYARAQELEKTRKYKIRMTPHLRQEPSFVGA